MLAHIRSNLSNDLRESELAELSGFSASAFSRAFRAIEHDLRPNVSRLRINRACELLMSSDVRVTSIWYEVGFNSVSNCNRQFLAQNAHRR